MPISRLFSYHVHIVWQEVTVLWFKKNNNCYYFWLRLSGDLSSLARDQTRVSCTDRWIFYPWVTWEVAYANPKLLIYPSPLYVFLGEFFIHVFSSSFSKIVCLFYWFAEAFQIRDSFGVQINVTLLPMKIACLLWRNINFTIERINEKRILFLT